MNRRRFLQLAAAMATVAGLAGYPHRADAIEIPGSEPFLALERQFSAPIKIAAIDQLLVDKKHYFRVRSTDGAEGIVPGNARLDISIELAKKLVIPYFVGKDARTLERLVDGVYTDRDSRGSVYKYVGLPFWNVVGHIEIALWDMLGKIAGKSVGQLLGGVKRAEIPVYMSQFGRETTPEQEVKNAAAELQKSGARGVKFKIGQRMANSPAQGKRDRRLIELARETFGKEMTIYVDANSSYTVAEAVEMGRFLEQHDVGLFEEPCPWQDYEATKRVAAALNLPVAGGEQDTSLWQWRDMIAGKVVDIVQPDMFYNGGLIRSLRVARMAEKAGLQVTPHSPVALPESAAHLHFCFVIPNLYGLQEYRVWGPLVNGAAIVPTGPGLGIEIDPELIRRAKVL